MQSYHIVSVARALTYKSMQRVSRPQLAGDCPLCFLFVDKIKRILLQHGRAVSCHPDAQSILGNLPNSYHAAQQTSIFGCWRTADTTHLVGFRSNCALRTGPGRAYNTGKMF